MLSEEIMKLEEENRRLKVLTVQMFGDIPKSKNCGNCKHYVQHYGLDRSGFFKLYTGHCKCGVPAKRRKGKTRPTPDDTCVCFEEKVIDTAQERGCHNERMDGR